MWVISYYMSGKIHNSLRFRLILVFTLLTASMSALNFWLIYGLLRWEEDFVFEQILRQQLEFIEHFPENASENAGAVR